MENGFSLGMGITFFIFGYFFLNHVLVGNQTKGISLLNLGAALMNFGMGVMYFTSAFK